MKSKQIPNMYQFPKELQWEYWNLMKSKEEFLRKVTPAEKVALAILYDRLKDAWEGNHTEELNDNLNKNYQELRRLQKELSKNWDDWKNQLEKTLITNMIKEEKTLQLQKNSLEKQRDNLRKNKLIWKKDILQKTAELEKVKKKYSERLKKGEAMKLKEQEWKLILKENENTLNIELKKLEQELEMSEKIETSLQSDLKEFKSKNQKTLTKKRLVLNEKQKNCKQNPIFLQDILKKKRDEMKLNLKIFENNLLKELTMRIQVGQTNCPKELLQYQKYGEFSAILEKDKILTRDTKRLLNLLEEELGKHNKTVDWFMANVINRN